MKIIIPEPCHEDWEKMTPANQGSFCDSCAKIVVDFTKMKDHEVINYFENHKEQKTCGRFLSKQVNQNISSLAPPVRTLNQPINLNFTIPELKKVKTFTHRFIVALLIIFGNTLFTSCGNGSPETLGKVVSPYTKGESIPAIDTIKQVVDSTKVVEKTQKEPCHFEEILGDVIIVEPKSTTEKIIIQPEILGEPEIHPNTLMKMGKPKIIEPNHSPKDTSKKHYFLMGDTIISKPSINDTIKKEGTK